MLTYGFYNSLNGDRVYNAIQMSSIFDGIIKDGIFMSIGDHMNVTAGTGMQVVVGSGRAWFNHTWTLNDTELPVEVRQSELVLDRIDALVLEINEEDSVRANSIKFVYGTPSSEPQKPELTNTATVHQYAIAYVTVRANVTEIVQADIENMVGTTATPYITGILETIDATQLIQQWQSQFDVMMSTDQSAFVTWFANKKVEYEDLMITDQTEFEEWFLHLQNELDENQAANLQRQIDEFVPIINAEIDYLLVV
jgi:hypothetical protein